MVLIMNCSKRVNELVVFLLLAIVTTSCEKKLIYRTIDGFTQGTTYHIVYSFDGADSLDEVVNEVLSAIDNSLSVYNDSSLISRINRGENIPPDAFFVELFNKSREIYDLSSGAFDISGAPLFDIWGFGFKNREKVTQEDIDSIKTFVGMDKIWIDSGRVKRSDSRVTLNMNAVAQGYTSDVMARKFDSLGVSNYMIEIGGEIFCKGHNPKGHEWNVGIDKPVEGNFIPGEELQAVIALSGKGLATSGNYRKFYEEGGKKYSHTIDPRIGYPVTHSLLSATVIAQDAMTADALATFFMVVGLDEAIKFLNDRRDIDAYLIYSENGQFKVYKTAGVKIVKIK